MSLDDIISKETRRAPGGGRRAPGVGATRSTRATAGARERAAPYQRGGRPARQGSSETDHMANASVVDVANSSHPTLKVKSESKPNTVAGAICNVIREARGSSLSVLATGPTAINQAIKAIAIARKYLLEEATPVDLICAPVFEQDVRAGSNVSFELTKSFKPVLREPLEEDLTAKEKTDVFKLAGAIAGRIRDGEDVAVTTKGPIPVLVVVKAIATAQEYLAQEGVSLKFVASIVDLENPELRDATSTYLHFAIVPHK
mmetsp:Transcript_41939/g.96087  ORF Transcript_41939/g.96087 Transcript_41939/m.96087 type:complete len:259 (+) Transcript_41939:445-1221(+)